MEDKTMKAKECALKVLNELHYDIEETEPTVVASTYPDGEQFSVFLDLYRLKFELKNPSLIENPEIKKLVCTFVSIGREKANDFCLN